MYTRSFFKTRLGQTAALCIAVMVTFTAFSTQIAVASPLEAMVTNHQVELA